MTTPPLTIIELRAALEPLALLHPDANMNDSLRKLFTVADLARAHHTLAALDGLVLVPREPEPVQISASLSALTAWRKTLTADEAILRRSAPIQSGRVWLASATPEEKAAIRYRAMIAPYIGEDK